MDPEWSAPRIPAAHHEAAPDLDDILTLLEARQRMRRKLQARLAVEGDRQPAGLALVRSAGDWLGAGRTAAIPVAVLRAQAERRLGRPVDDAEAKDALAWATAEPPFLMPGDAGGELGYYLARDAPDEMEPVTDEIPDPGLLRGATPLVAVAIGVQAWDRGRSRLAYRAFNRALASNDFDAAALASWHLARRAEPAAERRRAYQRVVASGHFDAAPRAMYNLALMTLDGANPDAQPDPGALGEADALLDAVVATGHPELVAGAAAARVPLREVAGDLDTALDMCRVAITAAGDVFTRATHRVLLVRVLARRGELAEARTEAMRIGDDGTPRLEAGRLAMSAAAALAASDDRDGAIAVLRHAYQPDDLISGPHVGLAIVDLYAQEGRIDEAEELLDQLRAHPMRQVDPVLAARVPFVDAVLRLARSDDPAARDLFTAALGNSDPEVAAIAHDLAMAFVRNQHRIRAGVLNLPGAEPLLRHVRDHINAAEDPDLAAWVGLGLSRIAASRGDITAASDSYRAALSLGGSAYAGLAAVEYAELVRYPTHPDEAADPLLARLATTPDAATSGVVEALGVLLRDDPRRCAALAAQIRDVAWHHINAGGPHAARIAFELGRFDMEAADSADDAITAWEATVAAGGDLATGALFHIGLAHYWRGRPLQAASAWATAAEAPGEYGARAGLALGRLADSLGDDVASFAVYHQLLDRIAAGQPTEEQAAEAAFSLGCLLRNDQPDDAEWAFHFVLDSPKASDGLIGRTLARLGELYARSGNRRLADRTWRRGRRHDNPAVATAFTTERKTIGRITHPTR